MARADVVVVGGGVSGLTTAVRLRESGRRVLVRAAAPWRDTVSVVAAAVWFPFEAYPAQRVAAWGRTTLDVFTALERSGIPGVRTLSGRMLWRAARSIGALDGVPSDAIGALTDRPPAFADGVALALPAIDMPIYLEWLEHHALALGVELEHAIVRNVDDLFADAPVAVNCSGLEARAFVHDATVFPIRGQVVYAEPRGVTRFTLHAEHGQPLTYIVPRSSALVLGGTAEPNASDLAPDPATARAIVERCTELEPSLSDARILGHRVGLRPGRPSVRLEREERARGVLIHNYGHGGAGVTLSWGCAAEVVSLMP